MKTKTKSIKISWKQVKSVTQNNGRSSFLVVHMGRYDWWVLKVKNAQLNITDRVAFNTRQILDKCKTLRKADASMINVHNEVNYGIAF